MKEGFAENYSDMSSFMKFLKMKIESTSHSIKGFFMVEEKHQIHLFLETLAIVFSIQKTSHHLIYDNREVLQDFAQKGIRFLYLSLAQKFNMSLRVIVLDFFLEQLSRSSNYQVNGQVLPVKQDLLELLIDRQYLLYLMSCALELKDLKLQEQSLQILLSVSREERFQQMDMFMCMSLLSKFEDSKAKSIQNYLIQTKECKLIHLLLGLFSKEEKAQSKSFDELSLMSPYPFSHKLQKNFYLYEGILDPVNNQRLLVTNTEILGNVEKPVQFLEKQDIQNLQDLMNIFINSSLDLKIRVDTIAQIEEVVLMYKSSPELKEFMRNLVSFSKENFFREEQFQLNYIKIIAYFLRDFRYLQDLKLSVMQFFREKMLEEDFRLGFKLLSYLNHPDKETRFMVLYLIQMVSMSSVLLLNKTLKMLKNSGFQVVDQAVEEGLFNWSILNPSEPYLNLLTTESTSITEVVLKSQNFNFNSSSMENRTPFPKLSLWNAEKICESQIRKFNHLRKGFESDEEFLFLLS